MAFNALHRVNFQPDKALKDKGVWTADSTGRLQQTQIMGCCCSQTSAVSTGPLPGDLDTNVRTETRYDWP
jgi:hypothetical protein